MDLMTVGYDQIMRTVQGVLEGEAGRKVEMTVVMFNGDEPLLPDVFQGRLLQHGEGAPPQAA